MLRQTQRREHGQLDPSPMHRNTYRQNRRLVEISLHKVPVYHAIHTSRLSKYHDSLWITSKLFNIIPDPFNCHTLIKKTEIQIGEERCPWETEDVESITAIQLTLPSKNLGLVILHRNDYNILLFCESSAIV
jgi:hypothetical protein